MSLVILGGGISGLLAAWVYRKQKPMIFESSQHLGGTYASGGLKYVRQTPAFEKMLGEIGVPFSVYKPRGGMLRETIYDGVAIDIVEHPRYLRSVTPVERRIWQSMHWRKTRGSTDGFTNTCMNDPMGTGDSPALAFDHVAMMHALQKQIEDAGCEIFLNARATAVHSGCVSILQGDSVFSPTFTRLLTTLPLPLQAKLGPWMGLPTAGKTTSLTIGFLGDLPDKLRALQGDSFDYIYTPTLPHIHRVSKQTSTSGLVSWQVEAAGNVDVNDLMADFRGSHYTATVHIPGHLLPLDRKPIWPHNILPIGRFAEWDSRAEACTVLDRAENLLRNNW